ncbi:MAG: putative sporulation protein YtxC [Desulfotomaculaceae bacterium]|nr:putative sporulation protein YtxC [Desulfotomaculaceae bacterium]
MGQTISIGATQHMELFKAKLGSHLKLCEGQGLKVDLEESPAGKFTFLSCHIAGETQRGSSNEHTQILLRQQLAEIISDVILNHWEDVLLKDMIRENYYYFGDEEKKLIFDYSLRHINREGKEAQNTLYWLSRKNQINQKIIDFLNYNNRIIVDGFIRFRLKEYLAELRDATEKAVDEFLMEREYREFIQLLQYFVEVQEPRMEIVHLYISESGSFRLFDDKMQPVRSDYMDGFFLDMLENEMNYEDLLISALITIAPRRINIHQVCNNSYTTTLETIRSVFTDRVSECPGCSLCTKKP